MQVCYLIWLRSGMSNYGLDSCEVRMEAIFKLAAHAVSDKSQCMLILSLWYMQHKRIQCIIVCSKFVALQFWSATWDRNQRKQRVIAVTERVNFLIFQCIPPHPKSSFKTLLWRWRMRQVSPLPQHDQSYAFMEITFKWNPVKPHSICIFLNFEASDHIHCLQLSKDVCQAASEVMRCHSAHEHACQHKPTCDLWSEKTHLP